MAAFNHLGLFPRFTGCPRLENVTLDFGLPDIWISSTPAFLYACAHYWRVKTWRINASATWTEIDGGPVFNASNSDLISQGIDRSYFTFPDAPEEDFVSGTTPTTETELICNYAIAGHSLVRSNQIVGTALVVRYSYGLSDSTGAASAIVRLDNSGNVSEVKTPFYFSADTQRWRIETYPYSGNTGSYGLFTYSLLGQNFTVPFYASNSQDSDNLTITASLVAEEYWPYDPNDGGGPIYDSATGAQLREF